MSTHSTRLASSLIVALCAALPASSQAPTPSAEPASELHVGVRFEGLLPGTHDEKLQGDFSVLFRMYLSPQGGDAVWSETRSVHVVDGRMDVELGLTHPIPLSIHEATFKFLGASVGGAREVYPRFTIVNTVYASPEEALRPAEAKSGLSDGSGGKRYGVPAAKLAARAEAPCTWKEALIAAHAAGGDLPDYRDWYAALAQCTKDEVLERSGHYEWVLPWVYDTASHGEYNRLYRGRFQGCDYMDLSPANSYKFRVASPAERAPEASAARPAK